MEGLGLRDFRAGLLSSEPNLSSERLSHAAEFLEAAPQAERRQRMQCHKMDNLRLHAKLRLLLVSRARGSLALGQVPEHASHSLFGLRVYSCLASC